jgi:tetratricopeptide (TPR) repeat protein
VSPATTASLPALTAYLEGEAAYRRSDFPTVVEAYRRAVAEDSTFALALWRLASALGWSGGYDYWSIDTKVSEQAAALVERLPARDAGLLRTTLAFDRGEPAALAIARDAAGRYPDDPDAWYLLGEVFVHSRTAVFYDIREGIEAFEKAISLDPTFGPDYIHLIELAIAEDDT